jgi:ribosomal-protein-alanine N-acetyltransferase
MADRPTLVTARMLLRPFDMADGPAVRCLAGTREIADTTLNIPHPYEEGMADAWIATHQEKFDKGELVNFAIVLAATGELVGAIGLVLSARHKRGELGYWIGRPYWGRGYCTEAAGAVVRFGFMGLGLARIHASHMARNPASGRVMQKIGMKYEGTQRRHIFKWDRFEDLMLYGLLRSEHDASAARPGDK